MRFQEKMLKKFSSVVLFKGLDEEQLRRIIDLGEICEKEVDQYIVLEKTLGNKLFVLIDGSVEIEVLMPVSRDPDSKTKESITRLNGGDVLGELALFGDHRRSASARVVKHASYITFSKDDLDSLFEERQDIGYRVMSNLSSILAARIMNTTTSLKNKMYQLIHPLFLGGKH
ncbi:MAG: hypothetical protein CMP10_07845 [Zetaproteobacteria bacterium]|nr:hypothetical protein [Pseudobdellovibrionaceae bacterium]